MTGCGETDEMTAARVHGIVAAAYAALFVLEGVLVAWHLVSVKRHLDRARGQRA